jgi:hypothetical protein
VDTTIKLSVLPSLVIGALVAATIGWSSPVLAGQSKAAALRHAPIELIRDKNGNPVSNLAGAAESPNWSGYVLAKFQTGVKYTSASATWIVPEVIYGGAFAASSNWVGIGGFCKNAACDKNSDIDKTLIQLGTIQAALSISETEYFAWYEMLPKGSVEIETIDVSPGDVITASLSCEGKCKGKASWTLSMMDETTGQPFSKVVKYKSPNLSAEWIVEAPFYGDSELPLADYDVTNFSAGMADGANADLNDADAVVMLNPAGQSSNVSSPSAALNGFNACFSPDSALATCVSP